MEMRQSAEQACIREQASIAGAVSKVNQVETDLAALDARLAALEEAKQAIREEILIGVTFETNSAKLTPEARAVLDVQANRLVRQGTLVEIAGYASTTGTKERNLELSQQRADSVRAYLIDRGVDKARVIGKGYGETDPIASNATEGGRRANQRIELHYLE
jgi:outer membrane protein OmpA-like peptidoglycan-associated protein